MRCEFAHKPRHPLKNGFHRLGADRHHAVLDLARQLLKFIEADDNARGAGKPGFCNALRQHRLIDDEFADEVDQPIDAIKVDADRRRRAFAFGVAGFCHCRGRRGRRGLGQIVLHRRESDDGRRIDLRRAGSGNLGLWCLDAREKRGELVVDPCAA